VTAKKRKPRRKPTPLRGGVVVLSWWAEHYTDFTGHSGWITMEQRGDGTVWTGPSAQVPDLTDILTSGALVYGPSIPYDAEKTVQQIKLYQSKRAAAAQLGHVSCQREGSPYLGDVVEAFYDERGDLRLRVKHFSGEPWPFEPLDQEVEVLR